MSAGAGIRPATPDDQPGILATINAAAEAWRGVIPADCWHEPYMSAAQLQSETAAGVDFIVIDHADGGIAAVMGLQGRGAVALIRHAAVLPAQQGGGLGTALLTHLQQATSQPMLVGTWADAAPAIAFYRRHGFHCLEAEAAQRELARWWRIPPRQAACSVVLADARWRRLAASVNGHEARPSC